MGSLLPLPWMVLFEPSHHATVHVYFLGMVYLPVVCLARSHLVPALELLLQAVKANAIARNSLRRNKITMVWLIKQLQDWYRSQNL